MHVQPCCQEISKDAHRIVCGSGVGWGVLWNLREKLGQRALAQAVQMQEEDVGGQLRVTPPAQHSKNYLLTSLAPKLNS